jgi:hypothetical protein
VAVLVPYSLKIWGFKSARFKTATIHWVRAGYNLQSVRVRKLFPAQVAEDAVKLDWIGRNPIPESSFLGFDLPVNALALSQSFGLVDISVRLDSRVPSGPVKPGRDDSWSKRSLVKQDDGFRVAGPFCPKAPGGVYVSIEDGYRAPGWVKDCDRVLGRALDAPIAIRRVAEVYRLGVLGEEKDEK